MEGSVLSPTEKQSLVSSFLEIAVGETADTATRFLQATGWKLEEAIQLFFVGNEGGAGASSLYSSVLENNKHPVDQSSSEYGGQPDGDEVRAPIPVKREVLYDNSVSYGSTTGYSSQGAHSVVPFRNFNEEMKRTGWEADQGATSKADSSQDNLASLYRPPFELMHKGTFEKAKDTAKALDKWFLVNVQSTMEFSSHMLNRDTWGNEAVAQTISSNFIFWQVYNDTEEGTKVCTYYKLETVPVILVIDPVTGQKMRLWRGMIQPENLLEDLLSFMDGSPKDHHVSLSHKRPRESSHPPQQKIQAVASDEDEELQRALAASMENKKDVGASVIDEVADSDRQECLAPKKLVYPPLPEEPKGDRNLLCRVGIRLPDGRRIQRSFFRSDPIQLLWSFCYSQFNEGDIRPFGLTQPIPGASKSLDYDSNLTFEQSGLANSMILVTWL